MHKRLGERLKTKWLAYETFSKSEMFGRASAQSISLLNVGRGRAAPENALEFAFLIFLEAFLE